MFNKFLYFTTLVLIVVAALLASRLVTTVYATGWEGPCGACTGVGSWCVEDGNGYRCGNASECGTTQLAVQSEWCPNGCTCGTYSYIGGSLSCANPCLKVESCGSTPPPPPPPPSGGGCTDSTWCTSQTECNNNGWTWGGADAGFCDPDEFGRCCPPSGGGPPPPPPPPPAATCSMTINPTSMTLDSGTSSQLNVTITPSNGTVTAIAYNSSNTGVARATRLTPSFNATVFADGGGTATITVVANVNGGGGGGSCSRALAVSVNASAWWQVRNGDVVTGGDLSSKIPTNTCTTANGCNPAFDLRGQGTPTGYPGLPIFGGTNYDFSDVSAQQGNPAEGENWIANSPINAVVNNYSYNSFVKQIPSDVVINPLSGTINGADLSSTGTVSPRGYKWFKVVGDATITGDTTITGSNKVVLLVDSGNLTVNGNVTIQTPGSGFFMAIVGKDSGGNRGNISLTGQQVNIHGMFFADGQFRTGTTGAGNDQRLTMRGAIAALGGVLLERNLGPTGNRNTPAEFFDYAPEIVVLFPQELRRDRIVWEEVAP